VAGGPLHGIGLSDVHRDEIGNVFAFARTDPNAPYIALAPNIDTVFPEGTPIEFGRCGKLLRSGISTTPRASLRYCDCRPLRAAGLTNTGPLAIGKVGEEGEAICAREQFYQQPLVVGDHCVVIVLDGAGTDTIIAEGWAVAAMSSGSAEPVDTHGATFGAANPIVALAA